ncbi:hypothetical protein ACF0H5_001135 [Mactra antiquata]
MIPESLADVFMEPPCINRSTTRKGTYDSARVFISDPVNSPSPSNNCSPADDDEVCVVCMTNRDLYWVGCDRCDAWYHYECLPSGEQTDVDLSLVCKSDWFCNACRYAEE